MLINLTNHPKDSWSEDMMNEAMSQFHSITDLPFPEIDPESDENALETLAQSYLKKIDRILDNSANNSNAILIMGEFTFCYKLINLLKRNNLKCIATTSQRDTIQLERGQKKAFFKFVKFREY